MRKVLFQHIIEDQEPVELDGSMEGDGDSDPKPGKRPMTENDVRECVEPRWSGTVAYRSLVRKERLAEAWRERGKESEHRLMKYPIIVSETTHNANVVN